MFQPGARAKYIVETNFCVRLRKISSRENKAEELVFTRYVTEDTTPNLRKYYHPFPFINIPSHNVNFLYAA